MNPMLVEYFGEEKTRDILDKVNDKTIEFSQQTPGTQLAVSVENYHKVNVLGEALVIAIDTIERVECEKEHIENKAELLEEENKELKDKFNFSNPIYLQKHRDNNIVFTSDRTRAKKALMKTIANNY